MRHPLLLLSFCLVVTALAGCGQKGPLVLPPTKPAAASSMTKPHAPAPAASSATPVSDQY